MWVKQRTGCLGTQVETQNRFSADQGYIQLAMDTKSCCSKRWWYMLSRYT